MHSPASSGNGKGETGAPQAAILVLHGKKHGKHKIARLYVADPAPKCCLHAREDGDQRRQLAHQA